MTTQVHAADPANDATRAAASPASSASRRCVEFLSLALLLILTFRLYRSVAGFDFVNLDDDDYVYRNPIVTTGLTLPNLGEAFRFRAANWHPLTWLWHMVDVEMHGLNAGRHHVVNVVFHLLNVALLYSVAKRLTGAHWKSLIVTALFAVHPLNVETVAWIAERKSLLSTTAWLAAMLAYHLWTTSRRTSHYVVLMLLFVAGLMSKPMIVTLPATLLILDFWPLGRARAEYFATGAGRSALLSLIIEKCPLLAFSLFSAVITYSAQSSWKAVTPFPIGGRVANAVMSTGWYLHKAFVPTSLCVYYPHPATIGLRVSLLAACSAAAAIMTIVGLVIAQARRRPYLLAGAAWYLITLLPVLGIIQVGGQAHADRYAYVPLIGVFVAVVWLGADLASHLRAGPPFRGFATLAVGALSVLTVRQVDVWRTSETLYVNALSRTGGRNPVARRNLASYYTEAGNEARQRGDLSEGLSYFARASAAEPDSARAFFNEAVVLSELGRYADAIPRYGRSLTLDPSNADAWLNLGDAYAMTGDFIEATGAYQRVLLLRPDKYADYGLAYVSAKRGDRATSATSLERLRRVDPLLAHDLRNRIGNGP